MPALIALVGAVIGLSFWGVPGALQGALFGYLLTSVLEQRSRIQNLERSLADFSPTAPAVPPQPAAEPARETPPPAPPPVPARTPPPVDLDGAPAPPGGGAGTRDPAARPSACPGPDSGAGRSRAGRLRGATASLAGARSAFARSATARSRRSPKGEGGRAKAGPLRSRLELGEALPHGAEPHRHRGGGGVVLRSRFPPEVRGRARAHSHRAPARERRARRRSPSGPRLAHADRSSWIRACSSGRRRRHPLPHGLRRLPPLWARPGNDAFAPLFLFVALSAGPAGARGPP